MPKLPVLDTLDTKEAERLLLQHGFEWIRTKGSHRIYMKDGVRVVLPYHAGKSLHPKIVKEVLDAIGEL